MRVLVVEDDPTSAEMLRVTIQSAGHEVSVCGDGLAALAALRREPIRVVVSDWYMPGMDGPSLCRAVRAEDFNRYVYILLLTASNDRRRVVEGISAGADDFLHKPFDPEELCVRLTPAERMLAVETRDLTIFALASLAESRDTETGAHLHRVRAYCGILATALQADPAYAREITAEFIRMIQLTSPLHDIGKVGIPDRVLLKPGRLDPDEFAIMKTHAEIGARTLENALREYPHASFLRMARDIALTHHEQWAGGGYPRGISGPDIPLAGRIMALADVYDALRSRRVYKEALDHDAAKAIILGGSGIHFDPGVVRAFLRAETAFSALDREEPHDNARAA